MQVQFAFRLHRVMDVRPKKRNFCACRIGQRCVGNCRVLGFLRQRYCDFGEGAGGRPFQLLVAPLNDEAQTEQEGIDLVAGKDQRWEGEGRGCHGVKPVRGGFRDRPEGLRDATCRW